MKIGVSGASGHVGSAAIAELQRRNDGHDIIAITRTPATVHGVTARHGNFDEPQTLMSAYAGLDRLLIIPTPELGRGGRTQQIVTAISAAVAADVRHICFISSAGTRDVPEPDMWASYFAAEQRLMRDARHWTILRMNYFMEAFLQQAQLSLHQGVLPGLGYSRVGLVARDDVGAAAAGVLSTDGHHGAIYNLTGPASLCGDARAAAVAAAVGRPYEYLPMSEPALRANYQQAGMPEGVINALISLSVRFREGGYDMQTGDVEQLALRPPVALQEVAGLTIAPKVMGAAQ